MSVQIDGSTGNIIAIKADYSGNVSIGGTLTYEDVTNIDAVGLITARKGIKVDDLGVQVATGATIDGATNTLTFLTNGSERIRVTSDGRVGINTDMGGAPASLYPFSVYRSTGTGYVYTETAQSGASAGLRAKAGTSDFTIFTTQGTGQLAVYDNTNTAERLRVDSSGRLLLACTTPPNSGVNAGLQIQHTSTANITLARNDSSITDGNALGRIDFYGNDGGTFEHCATIAAQADGAHAHGDKPMRLIFGTSADGAATPTERLRIDSAGTIKCGTSSTLKAEINSAIGGHQFISQCSDNNNGFEIYQQHGSTTTRNTFAVYANTGGGGAQELQFSIRGDGCVTKPKNPAFAARRIGDINISTSGNTDVVFNDELIDNGNNYNPSNGRFTASIAGTYYFGVNLYVGFSVTAVRVMHSTFNKNGSTYAAADLFGGTNSDAGTHYHPTGSSGMLIDLNVNDYVTFNLGSLSVTGSGNTFLYGTNGTRFFGYLVG